MIFIKGKPTNSDDTGITGNEHFAPFYARFAQQCGDVLPVKRHQRRYIMIIKPLHDKPLPELRVTVHALNDTEALNRVRKICKEVWPGMRVSRFVLRRV